ncbi:TolC family protein [Microbulbifer sp. SA54]|uniref:TolC family protein n=1 Tax=Microbulbifer sp. SA54 TaxID=3401577 RepID=UPI003AAA4FEF
MKLAVFVFILLMAPYGYGLSLSDFLREVSNGHPELAALEAQSGQILADIEYAQGAFDPEFIHKSSARLAGYYDGLYADQAFVQPLMDYNAELFSRYRISDGQFPVYEQQNQTMSGGEAALGIRLSLLQNRDFDKNRFKLQKSSINQRKWQQQVKIAQSEFYYSAIDAYLNWFQANHYLTLNQRLVDVTSKRRKGIEKRVSSGDLAAIALVEFDTRLMERKVALLRAKNKVQAQQQKLGYFVRSPQNSEALTAASADGLIEWPAPLNVGSDTTTSSELHPAIQAKQFELQVQRQSVRLAKSELLPKLDLEAAVSQDLGAGPNSLEKAEAKIGLQFSVPLAQRQAKAQKSKALLEMREKEAQLGSLTLAIETQLNEAQVNLAYAQQLYRVQEQQMRLAATLFEQEKRQFDLGASDFFLLNNRESEAFDAELKTIGARFNLYRKQLHVLKIKASLHHEFVKSLITS